MPDTDGEAAEILVRMADILMKRQAIDALCGEIAVFWRDRLSLRAVGCRIPSPDGAPVLGLSVRANEPYGTWHRRMEKAAREFDAVRPGCREADAEQEAEVFILPLADGDRPAALLLGSDALCIPAPVRSPLARWLNRVIELQAQAAQDALTGLYNRRWIAELAGTSLAFCQRRQQPVSILLADIDRFKHLNDTCGHRAGDRLLVHFATRLRQVLRGSDLAFRYGGDEFLVVLPDTREDQALQAARRLSAAFTPVAGETEALPPPCTFSAGVAEYRSGEGWEELIARADAALYRAKRCGRNQIASASGHGVRAGPGPRI